MREHDLKTYRLVCELMEHLQGESSDGNLYDQLVVEKRVMEAKAGEEYLQQRLTDTVGGYVINGVRHHLNASEATTLKTDGRKALISVIKSVRERTGLGLAQAKELVEYYLGKIIP